jgi:16S rRNA (cytosine967-C5)-methyltransferase
VIGEHASLQRKLLERAVTWLKPGGALVYSVCSLEPREGEEVIASFLRQNSRFHVEPPHGQPSFAPVSDEGWIRILPGLLEAQGGLDGFFLACLVRDR